MIQRNRSLSEMSRWCQWGGAVIQTRRPEQLNQKTMNDELDEKTRLSYSDWLLKSTTKSQQ